MALALILIGVVILGFIFTGQTAQAGVTAGTGHGWLGESVRYWAGLRALDPALVWGVVQTESSGDPAARNPSDPSSGLMGVTPLIGRSFGGLTGTDGEVLSQLLEPDNNMRAGTGFLMHLKNKYQAKFDLGTWVQAYNLGETKFDVGSRVPIYSARVLEKMKGW